MHFLCFLPVLGLMSDSLMTISVESHWCPSHQFILLVLGPIPLNFAKTFWELTVLKNMLFLSRPFWNIFFKKKFFFAQSHEKQSNVFEYFARMGRKFDDYPGFQQMRSWANTYAQDCMYYLSKCFSTYEFTVHTICTSKFVHLQKLNNNSIIIFQMFIWYVPGKCISFFAPTISMYISTRTLVI